MHAILIAKMDKLKTLQADLEQATGALTVEAKLLRLLIKRCITSEDELNRAEWRLEDAIKHERRASRSQGQNSLMPRGQCLSGTAAENGGEREEQVSIVCQRLRDLTAAHQEYVKVFKLYYEVIYRTDETVKGLPELAKKIEETLAGV